MDLAYARTACHHAVQLNTHLARGFIPARDDDSHTSLVWSERPARGSLAQGSFAGQWVEASMGKFRLALRVAGLTIAFLDDSDRPSDALSLDGQTFDEAMQWLAGRLKARGMNPSALFKPLHFQLDDDPLAHGARFSVAGAERSFHSLARHYSTASKLLAEVRAQENSAGVPRASEVRCWPHHFDIATLIITRAGGEKSETLGVGLSPGDGNYPEPYYYVTPWPYPDSARLPPLTLGSWHTKGWTGAVLLAGSLTEDEIRKFLRDAIDATEKLRANAGS